MIALLQHVPSESFVLSFARFRPPIDICRKVVVRRFHEWVLIDRDTTSLEVVADSFVKEFLRDQRFSSWRRSGFVEETSESLRERAN